MKLLSGLRPGSLRPKEQVDGWVDGLQPLQLSLFLHLGVEEQMNWGLCSEAQARFVICQQEVRTG